MRAEYRPGFGQAPREGESDELDDRFDVHALTATPPPVPSSLTVSPHHRRCAMLRLLLILCVTTVAAAAERLTWKQLAPLPDSLGVAGAFAGASGGALLVGGRANFPDRMPWDGGTKVWHDRVWVLESPKAKWREAGRLPRPLGDGVSVTNEARGVGVGGSDLQRHYEDAFRVVWKDGTLTTQPLPALPIALASASRALVGSTVIVVCGSEEPGEQVASKRGLRARSRRRKAGGV